MGSWLQTSWSWLYVMGKENWKEKLFVVNLRGQSIAEAKQEEPEKPFLKPSFSNSGEKCLGLTDLHFKSKDVMAGPLVSYQTEDSSSQE